MLLLVDLDGVVYRGRLPVPGVAAALAARAAAGDAVVYVTNNALRHRDEYLERLSAMGAPVSIDRVVTSARATALYLAGHQPRPRRVLALGGPGLLRELADVGLDAVRAADVAAAVRDAKAAAAGVGERSADLDPLELAGYPDTVVVGLDLDLTYRSLAIAADAIRGGARFIATNRDPAFPMEDGLRPGAGALVAAVETTTGVTPVTIGKPGPLLLEAAAQAVGADVREAVMIGDGLHTDMAAGRAVGCRTILMLTGVTTEAQAAALPPDERPTAIAADAAALAAALEALALEAAGAS